MMMSSKMVELSHTTDAHTVAEGHYDDADDDTERRQQIRGDERSDEVVAERILLLLQVHS